MQKTSTCLPKMEPANVKAYSASGGSCGQIGEGLWEDQVEKQKELSSIMFGKNCPQDVPVRIK